MKLQEIYDLIVESGIGQFSGAGIIFFDGNSVLMLKKPGGRWAFPGGKPIQGETPLQTAKRETREEVGMVKGENIGEVKFEQDNRTFYSYIYRIKKPFEVKISDEHVDYTWINFKKINKLKLHRNVSNSLSSVVKKLKSIKVEII
jgi:8-oxo-dGTP pyrophosphatase MutT (NUDIX family)